MAAPRPAPTRRRSRSTAGVLGKDYDEDEARTTGEVPPALILEEVGRLIEHLEILRTLPAGYKLWRARVHDGNGIPPTAAALGTAPRDYAKQANR